MKTQPFKSATCARVAPFAAFMAWIALEEGLRFLLKQQFVTFEPLLLHWLYLPRAALVGWILWFYRRSYLEINPGHLRNYRHTLLSSASGLLIFYLWINMDWTLGSQHTPAGFNPQLFESESARWMMVTVRMVGAVVIVPVMEELFWRSFLLRYLINSHFMTVEIGRYTLFSFVAVSVLFGLEHHYVFAGMMAGVLFNVIYYATRSIMQCIVSHAVANFCLALYVLRTGQWQFW